MSSFVESRIRLSIRLSIKISFNAVTQVSCLLALSLQFLQLLSSHSIVISLHWSLWLFRLRRFLYFLRSANMRLKYSLRFCFTAAKQQRLKRKKCRFRQVSFFRRVSYTAARKRNTKRSLSNSQWSQRRFQRRFQLRSRLIEKEKTTSRLKIPTNELKSKRRSWKKSMRRRRRRKEDFLRSAKLSVDWLRSFCS